MQRTLAILGATGSIGTQALDIARRYPDRFSPVLLSARSSCDKLFELIREFKPRFAALDIEPKEIPEFARDCEWVFGVNSSARALQMAKPDDALCAIVGVAGLSAVWTALDVCKRVLLANKEALVTGGNLVMEKSKRLNVPILPVDSEHSAIFQCLQAANGNPFSKIILTASGGALRDWDINDIDSASVCDVLKHPTWSMGSKITVDCATMMNKGFEVIEAHHLFDAPVDNIEVIIHPQSVIHSMVEFEDGAVLSQLGSPDMRGPIQYAMAYPERLDYSGKKLDFTQLSALTFMRPDYRRYPCLKLAIDAITEGGAKPVILNAVNEVAVENFLKGKINFGQISHIVEKALDICPNGNVNTIEDVFYYDNSARSLAGSIIGG